MSRAAYTLAADPVEELALTWERNAARLARRRDETTDIALWRELNGAATEWCHRAAEMRHAVQLRGRSE